MSATRLPAEWELQSGLLLTWPHPQSDWRPFLQEIEPVYVDIVRQCVSRETVVISCLDDTHRTHVRDLLKSDGVSPANYRLYVAVSNDSWTRDHGPITVLHGDQPTLLDFTFNGWGNKYPSTLDNAITKTLYRQQAFGKTPLISLDFILEGGSLETDGLGTLLTTTSCLLSPQRNRSMDKITLEDRLREYFCVDRIIWFEHGQLIGDDTDGHIDTLVRFADAETLLYVASGNRNDPNYVALEALKMELYKIRQRDGRPYRLTALPSPVIRNPAGDLLPASYANFLFINDAVLIPLYGVDEDKTAMEIFQRTFHDRAVIPIYCRPIINQFGSLHCITMQLPQGVIE